MPWPKLLHRAVAQKPPDLLFVLDRNVPAPGLPTRAIASVRSLQRMSKNHHIQAWSFPPLSWVPYQCHPSPSCHLSALLPASPAQAVPAVSSAPALGVSSIAVRSMLQAAMQIVPAVIVHTVSITRVGSLSPFPAFRRGIRAAWIYSLLEQLRCPLLLQNSSQAP